MFREALVELAKTEDPSNGVIKTLDEICVLYGCWAIEENAQHFLKFGFYSPAQMDLISKEVTRLCAVLRKSAVLLTDAFNFSDHIVRQLSSLLPPFSVLPSIPRISSPVSLSLPSPYCVCRLTQPIAFQLQINSPLGCYDGNVYERYHNRVKESNPFNPVHPYFERIIKPLIEREPLEMGDDADTIELDAELEEIAAERLEGEDARREEAEKTRLVEGELKKPAKE